MRFRLVESFDSLYTINESEDADDYDRDKDVIKGVLFKLNKHLNGVQEFNGFDSSKLNEIVLKTILKDYLLVYGILIGDNTNITHQSLVNFVENIIGKNNFPLILFSVYINSRGEIQFDPPYKEEHKYTNIKNIIEILDDASIDYFSGV